MSANALAGMFGDSFRSLRHPTFRLFWAGQIVSLTGTWMQSVAQLWLMHRLASSAFMLGLLSFLQFLPVLLFSLWGGAVADRVDKRRLLLLTQVLGLAQAIVLAVVAGTGVVQPWMLLVLAFTLGTIGAVDMPARQSFVIELVGKEDLPNAIALNSAAFNSARMIGPAIAGVLVATLGEAACFAVNAVSYLAVIGALLAIRPGVRTVTRAEGGVVERLVRGASYVRATKPIRNLLILLGIMCSLGFQYLVLLPVFARDILGQGPEVYGLLVTAFGVGSLVAAAWMTRNLDRWGLRRNLLVGLSAAALGLGTFAWSRALPLSLAMGVLAGFGLILYVASTNTLLQLTTEDRYRGRVMSFYTLMLVGTAPIGALVLGGVAQFAGAPVATLISAAVLAIGAVWVAYRLRVLAEREAQQPTEPVWSER
jgi:MFS family permease